MRYVPHEYQKRAIQFALEHKRCMLSLDMGLGKTSITLAVIARLLDQFAVNRVLIIAPRYVAMDTWPRELKKWDFGSDSEIRMAVAVGTAAQRKKAVESDADVVTINRENTQWLVGAYGSQWNFDMIVIDESSSFKSYSSQRFKALRKVLGKTDRVIELTGTPRPRSLEDLWPQIYLLDAGKRLGRSMTVFREAFEKPGRRNGMQIYEWIPRDGAEDDVYERISDVVMSMKAEDWISVPPVTVIDHSVALSASQRALYMQMCRDQIVKIEENPVVSVNAGALAGKLLQMANGAVYDEEGGVNLFHDHKLECLQEILESTEEPVMVFYWFKHDLDRLRKYFDKLKPREIQGPDDIADWNAGKIRLLFAHPASMGHGLNLQDGGRIIVWFSQTWSLELYQQANARLHRQGQKQCVQIHRIICEHTVDEDVVRALERKDCGQEEMLSAVKEGIYREGGQA